MTATSTCGGCGSGPRPAALRGPAAAPVFVDGIEIDEAAIAAAPPHHAADSRPAPRATAARACCTGRVVGSDFSRAVPRVAN